MTGPEAHHLRSVLRLNVGDKIIVFDGQGWDYHASIMAIDSEAVRLTLISRIDVQKESPLELVLAQGYLKDKKMDRLVRPLTEIGVNRWIPFRAKRSVSVPDKKRLQARSERWRKLSHEAVKQCGRSQPMAIEPATSFDAVMENVQGYDLKMIFYEESTSISLAQQPNLTPAKALILIGPEGGFEPEEVEQAVKKGFSAVGMGPRILRAETAAMVACALMQHRYGDIS